MPFTRISYLENQYDAAQLSEISRLLMQALIQHFDVPEKDCFQVFHAHAAGAFIYDPEYLNIKRSDGLLYFQLTLKSGRSREKKSAFYAKLAELLHAELKIRQEDIFVTLVETEYEDWTFGNGEAQMLELTQTTTGSSSHKETGKGRQDEERHPFIESGATEAFGDIAPAFAKFSDKMLFGEVWRRKELSLRDRSLITFSALMAQGNVEQLPYHLLLARENGLSEEEIVESITHLAFYTGWPRAASALSKMKLTFTGSEEAK